MIFRNGKLYALLPANEAGDTFFSHQGLTYAGLLTTEHASAEDICQVFVSINTYLKQAGVRQFHQNQTDRSSTFRSIHEAEAPSLRYCHRIR